MAVVLLRMALRPDRRTITGALGMAAALALPLVSVLVAAQLAPVLADPAHVAAASPGAPLPQAALDVATHAVASLDDGGIHVQAYIVGDPMVEPGHARASEGGPTTWRGRAVEPILASERARFPLLAPGAVLVHPVDFAAAGGAPAPTLARLPAPFPGVASVPARGADAFETATSEGIGRAVLVVVAASIPAVALVAVVFVRQEARSHAAVAATLAAMGAARQARLVLLGRVLAMVAAAAGLAGLAVLGLHAAGGPFGGDLPLRRLALAAVAPTLAALLAAIWVARASPDGVRLLRAPPGDVPERRRLPLPLLARPLLLGVRLAPILLVSALLFAVDVGFPLAAARVPATIAGDTDEWVHGAAEGLAVGRGVDADVADVAGLDPRVDAIVAEMVAPTLVEGKAAVVRGGSWDAVASYHGLGLEGQAPQGVGDMALGDTLARRLGKGTGDVVHVQGAHVPFLATLRVTGIVHGSPSLASEAFVAPALGRALAGLPDGQASVVRFRPQTQASLDAVLQAPPNLTVANLRIEPAAPQAGSVAHAVAEVANLGAQDGVRHLVLRIDGEAVGARDAVVPGHARREVAIPFIVPGTPFTAQVNPVAEGSSVAAGHLRADADRDVVRATVLDAAGAPAGGVEVALYADLDAAQRAGPSDMALARATTDAAGLASLPTSGRRGSLVVRADDLYARVLVPGPAGGLRVVAAWLEPSHPAPGQPATAYATLENEGTQTVLATLNVTIGGKVVQVRQADMGPGTRATVAFPLVLEPGIANLTVAGVDVRLVAAAAPGSSPPAPASVSPLPGGAVQARVAERVVGNAQGALLALGLVAMASSLTAISLGTHRALAERRHAAGIWLALGRAPEQVRSRAAIEAGVLGGAAMLAALVPVKLLFMALARIPAVSVFGHALPDPVGALFAVQATAAFAAACALTAYAVAGKHPVRLR